MEIPTLYEEFLSYLDLERAYSPLTIIAYRSDGRLFLRYLQGAQHQPSLEAVDRNTVRGYIAWLSREGLKANSIARRLHSLRSFWTYVRDNGYTDRDPFLRVSVPKRGRPLPVYLSADECTALLRAAERQSSALFAFRDRAILSLLVFTGLRRSELLALRLSSVDLGEGTLRVESGKGRKARLLPLAHQLLAALRDWVEVRPECAHDFLFTSQATKPLGRKGLMGTLARALQRASINGKRITLHTLRHSFACLMLQNGCDLFSLSQLLGHTRLDTTATYLHVNLPDLRRAVAKHPLDGM